MSEIKTTIAKDAAGRSLERKTSGLIGHVLRYHPESLQCTCDEHGLTNPVKDTERHTADIKVNMGKKDQVLKRVPCMVYSQGIISNGLVKGDRVWVQFIDGDSSQPVITGFYREPTQWEVASNTFKFAVANVFSFMTGG
ncbi:hypothetical protein [Virgibacillus salexigens]|uniref:Phage protein n=1 Tax=Virgibacillus massiliensis TaxID=1462526 RepID=A0A024QHX6_9BACI|nr:hypothetical protein [Virgibacillus massiliensis]CDQ41805.1 hypothetical protein BN990_04182 [Virgibacillus massiliensis]